MAGGRAQNTLQDGSLAGAPDLRASPSRESSYVVGEFQFSGAKPASAFRPETTGRRVHAMRI